MTLEEFSILVKAMKSVYADPKFIADKDAVKTWYAMLCDIDYNTLSEAIRLYMQTEQFPPTIAGLRQKVKNLQPLGLTPLEAWGKVRNALSRSGYYYNEEYDALPREIQKAVGCPENLRDWSQVDTSTLDTVIQSQFVKNYSIVEKRMDESSRSAINLELLLDENRVKYIPEEIREVRDEPFNSEIQGKLDELYKKLRRSDG